MSVVVASTETDFSIKPQAAAPPVDTSEWPLLLKNYDKRESSCEFQSWHFPVSKP